MRNDGDYTEVQWTPISRMSELEPFLKMHDNDIAVVEVGVMISLAEGRKTRILLKLLRDIGLETYFYSKIVHPRDFRDYSEIGKFKDEAGAYFEQMGRKERERAN